MLRKLIIAGALAWAPSAVAQETSIVAPVPPRQETCGFLSTGGETSSFTPVAGYSLLNSTTPLIRPEGDVDGILCLRSGIYLGPNDHHVITDLGVPFFIRDATRLATLEPAEGQLRLRFLSGQPTADEAQALGAAIDRAHADIASGG